ncbi:GAF domain-containing protein [Variovorax sp. HJSM1_2]|uniref:GAF domain-containing protein n=1 Tax=Variovorax sp. HJSM1_2 TaxID=3366263 RepID=UPI003BDD1558
MLQRPRTLWTLVLVFACLVASVVWWSDQRLRAYQRLDLLQTESRRSSVELMSATLNGSLMGAVALLGLLDGNIKAEADKWVPGWDEAVVPVLATVGQAYNADGVFVVGRDGKVASSWEKAGPLMTGTEVGFRPYVQLAMKGQTSIYAAVSLVRGERSLFYSAPVFFNQVRESFGTGAVVARTSLARVDQLLTSKFDAAMLLSPQGIVFAASRPEWIGQLTGQATPQRLQAIRELKQFGDQFDKQAPALLALDLTAGFKSLDGKRYALAAAQVDWNDPSGPWTLVVLEDLSRTITWDDSATRALLAGALALVLARMLVQILHSRRAERTAAAQLQRHAEQQQQRADFRQSLGELSLQMQAAGSLEALSLVFFRQARELVGAVQGVLYVTQASWVEPLEPAAPGLWLAGFSACADMPPPYIAMGEGLLGQCAADGRAQLIDTPPEGVWNLRSGLGGARAAVLSLRPLLAAGRLVGVLELGLRERPGVEAAHQMDDLVQLLTSQLDSLRRHGPGGHAVTSGPNTEKAET